MAIYDGNQLPESPTSVFQMAVSVMYALQVLFLMSYGAVAVLAAHEQISTELQATQYMRRLVRKHNAIVRGMLAFIPATYSLGHLYTSSLHNGSLYSASNVFYVAIFAFATIYLGGALMLLVKDANHVDTIKAVYEVLYFLSRCCAKLSAGPHPVLPCMERPDETGEAHATKAWKSPWVMFNCFLSIASLDDARIWGQFLAWIRRRRRPSARDFVPVQTGNRFTDMLCRVGATLGLYPAGSRGYAYWLFSQDANVYNYTGSVIVEQAIPEKLSIASFSTREMYPAAQRFMTEFAGHFQSALVGVDTNFKIICSAGNTEIAARRLMECLYRVNFENQGLNMAVERYICRHTPDYAALSLPVDHVVSDIYKWAAAMYNSPDSTAAADRVASALAGDAGSFYCTLWLGYMHMALLGLDLLRMHNNKAVFADFKKQQAGFFEILGDRKLPDSASTNSSSSSNSSSNSSSSSSSSSSAACLIIKAAADGSVTAARKPAEKVKYPELHNLSVEDLHSSAAILATLLLVKWMHSVEELPAEVCAAVPLRQEGSPTPEVIIKWEPNTWDIKVDKNSDHWVASSSYLRKRAQLVSNYSSLPAIVQPVQCPPPSRWVHTLLGPLGFIIACIAIVAVTFATISCSNGVFLAAIAGLVQAYGAWALLLQMEQLPIVKQVHYKPVWTSAWGPLGDVAASVWQLLMTLISPALSLAEFILELVLYTWRLWTFEVLVTFALKAVTRGRDARAKWLQPHGPFVTVLAQQCSAGDEAGTAAAASADTATDTLRVRVAKLFKAHKPQPAVSSPRTGMPGAGQSTAGADLDTMPDQGMRAQPPVGRQQQQQRPSLLRHLPRREQLEQGEASSDVETPVTASSERAAAVQRRSVGDRVRWVGWLHYTVKARNVAAALVPSELAPGELTYAAAAATAAVVAAGAVATEGCCVAVLETGLDSHSVDKTLDQQLAAVHTAVSDACEIVWKAESADVQVRAQHSQEDAAAAAAGSARPPPNWHCHAVGAAAAAKHVAKARREAADTRLDEHGRATSGGTATSGGSASGLASDDIQQQIERVLFFIFLLKVLGISLYSCFDEVYKRLYKHRIHLGDLLVHSFLAVGVVLFAAFVGLALTQERYYAEGVGMCIGRCGGRADCWNNITLQLPLFDGQPGCPGEGRFTKASELPYHQCPAMLMVLTVSDISMDNKIVTTAPAASSSAGDVSKLTGNFPAAAVAAAAAAEQPGGISGRRLQSGCSCYRTSPPPAAAADSQRQGGSGSSSSSPSPGAAGIAYEQPGDQQYASPAPDGTQPGTAAAGSPALGAFASPGTPTGDGTSSNTGSSSSSSPSPAAGQNEGAQGDTQPSPSLADVPPTIPNSSSPGVLSTPPTGDTAATAYSPSPAGVSTATRDAGGGASPSPSSSPSPSPGAIIERGVLPTAGQDKAAVTSCTAKITLLDSSSSAPAKEGVSVTAVWYTMFGGRNALNDRGGLMQNATVVTAKTSAKGIAVFTSPPINASSGYGCNITILQPSDGSYELDEKGSTKLWNMMVW